MHDQYTRKRLYKLLAVANRELAAKRAGWLDDDYRSILQQCGATEANGKISATTMTVPQMEQALWRFKKLGFHVKKRREQNPNWRAARIAKLNALWCALADAGVVKNRSEAALEAYCRRHLNGTRKLQWARSEDLNTCIETLKRWALRVCPEAIKE